MRLVNQGLELYATGALSIRLADPQAYFDFGDRVTADPQAAAPFMAQAEDRFNQTRTALPSEPDTPAVEAWLVRVRRSFWQPA